MSPLALGRKAAAEETPGEMTTVPAAFGKPSKLPGTAFARVGRSDVEKDMETIMSQSLTLKTRLEYDKVAVGKSRVVHLLVSLEGAKFEADSRKPLSISAAIDVSGSMGEEHGKKIQYAKRSLQKLIDHLTEKDTLSIVAFSDTVWTVFETARMTSEAKEKAKAEVEKLHPHQSTNLSGATYESYEHLKEPSGDVVRSFLFTDGLPTAGETHHDRLVEIARQKPSKAGLTCFGYGNDHDPELLASMAKAGGGNFYFIKTPDQCAGTFGRELGGLLTCVAQAIKVKVKAAKDVRVKEVLNDLDVKGKDDESEAVVSVDDVYAEENRKIVLKLEIPEGSKALMARAVKVCDVEIAYQDLLAREPRAGEAAVKIEYVKDGDEQKEPAKEVEEQIALIQAAEAQEEAEKLANKGDFAGAKNAIKVAMVVCRKVGTQFAHAIADDLDRHVMKCFADEHEYRAGGQNYAVSNRRGYLRGRGATIGTHSLFSSSHQKGMAAEFEEGDLGGPEDESDPMPSAPVPGPVVQKPSKPKAKTSRPAGLSKTRRTRR